jgi:integrase
MKNSAILPAKFPTQPAAFVAVSPVPSAESSFASIPTLDPVADMTTAPGVPPPEAADSAMRSLDAKVKQFNSKVAKRTKTDKDGSVVSEVWDVHVGSAVVKVYFTPIGKREVYTISYWVDGKRKRDVWPTLDEAIAAAKEACANLARGDLGAAELSAAQRVACVRAMQLVEPTGVPIEVAAGMFAQGHAMLAKYKGRVSMLMAIESFVKRHPVDMEQRRMADVVAECIEAKRQDGASERYQQCLRWGLGRFAEAFHGDIGAVLGTDVDAWLRQLKVAPRTRNNLRGSVQALFNFAKGRRYLPKDHDEIESVTVVKDAGGDIEIFTPAELSEILSHAGERLIPFFALGAFAGIRHAEIQRLAWPDIRFDDGIVEVRAAKAKTASRRIVPLVDCLKSWLEPIRQESGPVCAYRNMAYEIDEVVRRINRARRAAWAKANKVSEDALGEVEAEARRQLAATRKQKRRIPRGELPWAGAETAGIEGWAAFKWKHNALRHSFISYRVAATQNVAQVALEAGNSPQMIFKHYRELVRPADAVRWFSIKAESRKAAR